MSTEDRVAKVYARCVRGGSLGERTTAYKVLTTMLDNHPHLHGVYRDAFRSARTPETAAHLAVDLAVATGVEKYNTGIDYERVKAVWRSHLSTLDPLALHGIMATLMAMRKQANGILTGDNLRSITLMEWPVEQALRATTKTHAKAV